MYAPKKKVSGDFCQSEKEEKNMNGRQPLVVLYAESEH